MFIKVSSILLLYVYKYWDYSNFLLNTPIYSKLDTYLSIHHHPIYYHHHILMFIIFYYLHIMANITINQQINSLDHIIGMNFNFHRLYSYLYISYINQHQFDINLLGILLFSYISHYKVHRYHQYNSNNYQYLSMINIHLDTFNIHFDHHNILNYIYNLNDYMMNFQDKIYIILLPLQLPQYIYTINLILLNYFHMKYILLLQ